MANESFQHFLWRLITTLLIIIPGFGLMGHYILDKHAIEKCEKDGGSYSESIRSCDFNEVHKLKPYQERYWKIILLTEIAIICGLFVKLILRYKRKKYYPRRF